MTLLMAAEGTVEPRLKADTHERAPGVCSGSKALRVYQRFHGILHLREQNFHPAKCSTIFNRLNIREQAPGAN